MTILVTSEFTQGGDFAMWEGGSFNPKSDKGWAVLVADKDGQPQQAIYEKNPHHSKNHYLMRVTLGSLVAVTNFSRMSHSRDLYGVRVVVGRVDSLSTVANPKGRDTSKPGVAELITPIWSGSFLSRLDQMQQNVEMLSVTIPDLPEEVTDRVREMIANSVCKASTLSEDQRMFWCVKRDPRPPKKTPRKEQSFVPDQNTPASLLAPSELRALRANSDQLEDQGLSSESTVLPEDGAPDTTFALNGGTEDQSSGTSTDLT